jgi:hypothetical protein
MLIRSPQTAYVSNKFRDWRIISAAILLIVAAAGIFLYVTKRIANSHGTALANVATGWEMSQDVGHTFTNGWVILHNGSGRPITLVKVEPVFSGSGLELIGTKISGRHRKLSTIQYEPRFPPTNSELGQLVDTKGFVLEADKSIGSPGAAVMLGLKVTKTGRSTIRAVDVTYRQDGEVKTQRLTTTLAVCAPKLVKECPQEPGES